MRLCNSSRCLREKKNMVSVNSSGVFSKIGDVNETYPGFLLSRLSVGAFAA